MDNVQWNIQKVIYILIHLKSPQIKMAVLADAGQHKKTITPLIFKMLS